MSGKNRAFLLAAIFLVFSVNAFASQPSVSISPKDKSTDIMELYPDEIGELEISVFNNSSEQLENINLRISVEEPLVIMRDGTATTVINESVDLVEPSQTKFVFVQVKPRELSQEKQLVYVNYGSETFTHIAATYVKIIESPLDVQARLAKSALDSGEGSKLTVTITNKGSAPISNITAKLVLPTGLSEKSQPLSASFLSSRESVADREFLFDVDPIVVGEKKLVLQVSFEDSSGIHVLERDFFIDVQNRRAVLYFIVAAIAALIVIALYLKRKPSKDKKQLEQPEVKELEGKEIKTAPIKGKEVRK